MRISDWSSDVCSSDLETGKNYLVSARSGRDMHGDGTAVAGLALGRNGAFVIERASPDEVPAVLVSHQPVAGWTHVALVYDHGTPKIGRASCRERVCQYV